MSKNKKLQDDLDAEFDFEQKLVNSCAMGLYGADLLQPLDLSKIPFKKITVAAFDSEMVDMFGKPLPVPTKEVISLSPTLIGEDILTIRALTGKRKDEAIKALNAATVEMMDKASPDCFYIPGDVRSSKNSKEIGRFKKRNALGQLEDFTTLVESKAAKAYRKATAGYWMQNKVAFLNQSRGLKLPLKIEFTFIRETLRRWDFVNGAQILLDLMVEFGYIPDDETCYVVPVFNSVYYHRELCGVLIRIIK